MAASHRLAALFVLCALALSPRIARGEADVFGLGDASDGSPTNLSGPINRVAAITTDITAGTADPSFTFGTPAGTTNYASGDLVMLWQPTGLPAEPDANQASTSVAGSPVGAWEFAVIATVGGSTMTLTAPTLHSYAANRSQVVRVPQYGTVTISGTVSSTPWDGSRGGIVVFLATGAVSISGTIDASADGFRGGAKADNGGTTGCTADFGPNNAGYARKGEGIYWQDYNGPANDHQNGMGSIANAGGGGDCQGAGGGGGGHGGKGGKGGGAHDRAAAVGGNGGGALDDLPPDLLVMGGGGGAGEASNSEAGSGAAGGGVVFLRALSLSGSGSITVAGGNGNGTSGGHNAGGGGGGAGGSVVLRMQQAAAIAINASGGNGGATGSGYGCGGGGAGGRVFVQATGGSRTLQLAAGNPGATTWSCAPAGAAESGVATSDATPFCFADSTCTALTATPFCLVSAGQCVACADSGDCSDRSKPVCDGTTHACRACTGGDCGSLQCDTGSGRCVECLTAADCTDPAKPACAANTCVPCAQDSDCTAAGQRVCQTSGSLGGQCTECSSANVSYCAPATAPACSAASGDCTTCTGNQGSAGDAPCPTTAKPVCTGGLCYQCSTTDPTAWCPVAAPACRTTDRTCAPCNGDHGSAANAPCPTAASPACTAGRCYQCSGTNATACTTAEPACRTTDWTCAACDGDHGSAATASCPTGAAAWCVLGTCHECTPSHVLSCTSAKPACSLASLVCLKCDSDYAASSGDARCPDPDFPACDASGQCLECSSTNLSHCQTLPDRPACMADHTCGCSNDGDCRTPANQLRLCNTTTDTCFDGCRGNDDRCPAGQHCSASGANAGVCVADPGADAGMPDVGQPDVGQPDVGQPDAGQPDVGSPDTGTREDVGVPDTGPIEPPDAQLPPDTGLPADATVPQDAAVPDGAVPDTGIPVVRPDASLDGGELVPPTYDLGGCGCGSAPGTSLAPWALFGLAVFAAGSRRRR